MRAKVGVAETLKYLYLMFTPDKDLGVFNTEAHPFRSAAAKPPL